MISKESPANEEVVLTKNGPSDDGIPTPWRFFLGLSGEKQIGPIFPTAAWPLREPEQLWRHYPLLLSRREDGIEVLPMLRALNEALQALEQKGDPAPIFAANRFFFIKAAASIVHGGRAVFGLVRDTLFKAFQSELDMSQAGLAELDEEWSKLAPYLEENAILLGSSEATPLHLYFETLKAQRGSPQKSFHQELRRLYNRLGDLLRLEKERNGINAQGLAVSMGKAETFFDARRMAQILPAPRGSKSLDPSRLARIETTRRTLGLYLEEDSQTTDCTLIHSGDLPAGLCMPPFSQLASTDCFGAAIDLFYQLAEKLAVVFRAVRVARLEVKNEYLPERHDEVLANFSWRDSETEEKKLLPAILVLARASQVVGPPLSSFCNLLCSGLPIQVILFERPLEKHTLGKCPDPTALAMAFRDVFVLRASQARPEHLGAGFAHALEAAVTSLAVVAVPAPEIEHPLLLLETALHGRTTPLYYYDPSAGESMADRFCLESHSQQDVDVKDEALELTFAEVAALLPAWREHFFLLPVDQEENGLMPLDAYLLARPESRQDCLPFISVFNLSGDRSRAVITRELAQICSAGYQSWRALQEKAGIHNEYVRRAEMAVRESSRKQVEQSMARLAEDHAEELNKTRSEAGRETMESLARVLLGMDPATLPAAISLAVTPVAAAPAETVLPAAQAEPVVAEKRTNDAKDEDEDLVEEAYIDTDLCTSCDECTNLNGRLFKYNGDGMAFIADLEAGSFAELVLAAEACPAKIIHPGAAREGDGSVTDALIARAAVFN